MSKKKKIIIGALVLVFCFVAVLLTTQKKWIGKSGISKEEITFTEEEWNNFSLEKRSTLSEKRRCYNDNRNPYKNPPPLNLSKKTSDNCDKYFK